MSLIFKVISGLRPKIRSLSSINYFSSSSDCGKKNVLQHLQNRSLVKIKGIEAAPFLQGLITNDMRHLEDGAGSMYAMFLNTKGRVLYESIIYVTEDPDAYLLECDKNIVDNLQKHLKIFRVKKKIDLDIYPYNIWVLFDMACASNVVDYNEIDKIQSNSRANVSIPKFQKIDNIFIYKDPRSNLLGSRILCDSTLSINDLIQRLDIKDTVNTDEDIYRNFRYGLGVGEGVEDLPPGNCFPLEANADFLHGVSFHKGCYIGQELTARTHHTGVVRKRLMPLLFKSVINKNISSDAPVFPLKDDKTAIGKVRGVTVKTGLGLLRVAQALDAVSLNVSGCEAKTYRPQWWPTEAPKEKILAAQEES